MKVLEYDVIYKLWCQQNLLKREIVQLLGCSVSLVERSIKFYHLQKTPQQISEAHRRGQKNRTIEIPKDFERLYFIENKTAEEVGNLLGLTECQVRYLVQKTGKYKTREQKEQIKKKIIKDVFGDVEKRAKITEKRKKTCRIRYGCDNPLQSEIIKKKLKNTNLQKYGVENPFQSEEVKKKCRETCKQKYDKEYFAQTEECKMKIMQTSLNKRGVKYSTQDPVVKEKIKIANLSNHGGKFSFQEHIPFETLEILASAKKFTEYITTLRSPTVKNIAQKLGVSTTTIQHKVALYDLYYLIDSRSSYYEEEIALFLDDLKIKHQKSKKVLYPQEIDLYCPEYSIGIEFNGDYWHREERMGQNYHMEKSLKAREKGVFLYHIFEYEWKEANSKKKIKQELERLFEYPSGEGFFNNFSKKIMIDIGKRPVLYLEETGYRLRRRFSPFPHAVVGGRFRVYDCGSEEWEIL